LRLLGGLQTSTAVWTSTLTRFVYPIIGPLAPGAIDTALVLKVLKPIWTTETVTAGHVRERIEKILDAAKLDGLRDGPNPAQWRGHLEHIAAFRTEGAQARASRGSPLL
jgi:hypothetical protein